MKRISAYNLALSKFLVRQLGLISVKQIITENTPEEYKEKIREEFRHIDHDVSLKLNFWRTGFKLKKLCVMQRKNPL